MKSIIPFLKSKRVIRFVYLPTTAVIFFVFICNSWVKSSTKASCYDSVKAIASNDVGLLLGTSKAAKGGMNLFFKYRIEAAASLFFEGKIKHIIVSGDNHIAYYNEPEEMKNELIKLGVPDSCITLDYAGFRTLDSVVRCEKVFGQKKFTIISQLFHNERALFIAKKSGLDCIAFNAKDVPGNYGIKTSIREYFARGICVLDIYILNTEPKFLGTKVEILI
jgi:SanA protein